VPDAPLRDALADEVTALKAHMQFGLVYERHLPETVALAVNGGLRVDDQVRLRTNPQSEATFRVASIRGPRAVIADESGKTTTAPIADLLVVRRFGEPIYPTLTPLGAIKRSTARPYHAVINGENYHALQLLLHTCARQVDCIYIDPPYNKPERPDWKYNNSYVDATDNWRHSKWLSFMEKRLRLAKGLLKPDGVLIVTVDENEVNHLAVLLEREDLFRDYLRYMVTILINPKGTAEANFGRVEEHAIFCVPNLERDVIARTAPPEDAPDAALTAESDDDDPGDDGIWVRELPPSGALRLPSAVARELGVNGAGTPVEITVRDGVAELRAADEPDEVNDEREEEDDEKQGFSVLHLRRRGAESSFRKERWRQFYAIKVDTRARKVVGIGPLLDIDAPYRRNARHGDIIDIYPIDEDKNERVWRYGRDTMQQYIDAGEIRVATHSPNKPQPYTLNHWKPREGPRMQRIRTVWWRTSHDAGTHGTTLLSRLLGTSRPFAFPKSLYAVRDCLEAVVRERKDALILDFFAGSGTTLHATCLLNAADDGRRRTILVTNNEVEEKLAKRLQREDHFPGDPAFEEHGIFEAVTRPRCEAMLTGKRPDGTRIPTGKKYQYLDGRPFAQGFDENCEFFRLDYLNPDKVELARAFDQLHPLLWLRAGAQSPRPKKLPQTRGFALVESSGYAVLFDEAAMPELIVALRDAPSITCVYLRTDSDDAYAEMCELLGPGIITERLYGDYLDSFRRGVRQAP